ncbi:eukaryotic translation initiation factor 4 gamma 1 isoform X2 [Anabrus simplex]|uniref:eukaryotic translation initiation factor 4 gamma 1 isoform X2 n=1 Tax=Anabrus simplex TaxID=316456 RepID=UPI0035A31723
MVSRYGGRKEPTMHCFMSHCGQPPPQHPPPPAVSQFRIISANTGRPEVSFHVAANFPPQQTGGGGPPGGPQLRGLHHPHHGANPPIPPPHQQQPPSQTQHSGGPPGPAPTSTPPGPADMGKQGPPHLQGQPQMPQGGQMPMNYGVPNQPRPNQSQTYYTAPRVPNPRLQNHRGQVVNNVGQQIFPSHVQLPQMPMYPSHVVPAPITPNPVFVGPGQIPMFSAAPTRHQGTGTGYFPPANQQQLLMHQHQQLYPGYQSGPQGPPYYFSGVQPRGGMGGAGGPGLGGGGNQQVVVPGAPPQISQGPQVPIMSGGVIVPGMTGETTAPAGAVGSGAPAGKPARRKYAVDIVDPKTMKNIDLYESSSGSTPPRSGESSDRETPQPTTGLGAMTVAADFAARVAKAANEPSSGPSPVPPCYSETPSSALPAQVVSVNGPDLIMNSIVTSSEGVLSQPDASISKSQIVVVDEPTISAPSWKQPMQAKTASVSVKSASVSKSSKTDGTINKDDHSNGKLESDCNNIVKERERPVPPGIPSVSAKDIPTPPVPDIPVSLGSKEHEVPVPTQQDLTPVVSALTNSPDVELNHHRLPRDQYPGLRPSGGIVVGNSSVGAHPSPRRRREPVEKTPPPQSASLVPNIAVVSLPSSVTETKPQEHLTPPVITAAPPESKQQSLPVAKKPFPTPETPAEEISPFMPPPPKERRDPEKSSRGREKSSQGREGDKTLHSRDKSQGHDREKSLQGRSKGSPVPVSVASTSQPEAVVQTSRPAVKLPTVSVPASAQSADEPKIQTNGEMLDGPEGKAGQRPKHNRRQQKMRDTRKAAEREGPEMDAFNEPPAEDTAPAAVPSRPVQSESQDSKNEAADADEEEKLIAARNEENAKVSAAALEDEAPIIENPPPKTPAIILKHNYKEDQWSPLNPKGKKKYERDFLIGLKNDPQSKKKPDILPDLEVVLKDNRQQSRAMDMSRSQHESFTPKFMSSGNSRGGPPPQRKSQQGNKSKGNKSVIQISLSLKEEVKLRETENAWKPGRGKTSVSDEEAKTEDLYKKVRGVLNKLTPEKFQKLVSQVKSLPIDTSDRLQGVINLVFEKAIDEPGFSVGYAQMCKILSNMRVPADGKSDTQEFVNFRKLLIIRCQQEFEKNNEEELKRDARFEELKNIEDPERKKELQLQYEEEERRMRMKSVGNIRFIGELFKLDMLTVNIMHRCIRQLLQDKDEESLECLCKLLTTIGKDLEVTKSEDLSAYFKQMKEISQKRGEISSRVRFMIQDVIELRQSKWVPRRDESNPKTIDQIQREAEKETLDQQIALSTAPPTPRRQEDRSGGGDRRKNRNVNEDGWSTAGSRSKMGYALDTARLKQKVPEMDSISLGNRSTYTNWTSNLKVADSSKKPTLPGMSNYFSALENIPSDSDKRYPQLLGPSSRPGTQKSTPSPSTEKERMLSPFKLQGDDTRTSRGGSVQQSSRSSSRDNSTRGSSEDTQRSLSSLPLSSAASSVDLRKSPESSMAPDVSLSADQVAKKTVVLLDEYFNNSNETETALSVAETFGVSNIIPFVIEALNSVLEKSSQARQNIGKLMCHLIRDNVVTKIQFLQGFSEIISQADDLAIDIPMIFLYLAEILVPLLSTETLSFSDFREVARLLYKFVLEVLQLLSKERGPGWIREKWVAAGIDWSDFIESERVDSFVKEHNLDYTLGDVSSSHSFAVSKPLSMEEVQQKLVQFLKPEHASAHSFDEICDWIGANVGDRVSEPRFIRALMTAICETAVTQSPNWKLRDEVLIQRSRFFKKYVDNKEELELQCLYAVQAFVHRLEHPQGLLCSIFQVLWDNNFISNESFIAWHDSKDSQESPGKGVALKSSTSFFTALREGEDDSEES